MKLPVANLLIPKALSFGNFLQLYHFFHFGVLDSALRPSSKILSNMTPTQIGQKTKKSKSETAAVVDDDSQFRNFKI